jgi:glycosyltransferase involved in cell wall biosynthesis
MLVTITNLFPRPDQPNRGLYNLYLFREMEGQLLVNGYSLFGNPNNNQQLITNNQYLNICLVPEWRVWRWPAIRRWKAEGITSPKSSPTQEYPSPKSSPARGEERGESSAPSPSAPSPLAGEGWGEGQNRRSSAGEGWGEGGREGVIRATVYLPVFTLPLIGRSLNWWFYCRALRRWIAPGGELLSCQVPKLLNESAAGSLHSTTQQPNNSTTDNAASGVILTPWLYPDGVAVARTIRGTGARLWLMALGSDTFHLQYPLRRHKILEACEQAEGIICVAQVLADRLAAAGVPRSKLHVVPNGVDSSLFRMRSEEELLVNGYSLSVNRDENNQQPITDNSSVARRTILYVGNLVPVKGPDILLRAFAELVERLGEENTTPHLNPLPQGERKDGNQEGTPMPPLHLHPLPSRERAGVRGDSPALIMIGEGPERDRLGALAQALGISDRVHFLGRRPPEEVALWMNQATVLCVPSRSEGMPNVVLEARASGLPVVTTPAGAIPELPLDQAHFLVVESCCPEALATGLQEMLTRDLSRRKPDPAIPTWSQMAGKIFKLMGMGGAAIIDPATK